MLIWAVWIVDCATWNKLTSSLKRRMCIFFELEWSGSSVSDVFLVGNSSTTTLVWCHNVNCILWWFSCKRVSTTNTPSAFTAHLHRSVEMTILRWMKHISIHSCSALPFPLVPCRCVLVHHQCVWCTTSLVCCFTLQVLLVSWHTVAWLHLACKNYLFCVF